MGNELQSCCTSLETANQPEADKTNLFDFRYSATEDPENSVKKEDLFLSQYKETRPYSRHLKSIHCDPYEDYDKYKDRGDSVHVISTQATPR